MIDIITVTYSKEFDLQRLQSRSLELFHTAAYHHHIVIEDTVIPRSQWLDMLGPYYRDNLSVISAPDDGLDLQSYKKGWLRQQRLKLDLAHKLGRRAVMLDSKNFLVRATDFGEMIPGGVGVWSRQDQIYLSKWQKTVQFLDQVYGEEVGVFWLPHTPFMTDPDSLELVFQDTRPRLEDLIRPNRCLSEFILLSYWQRPIKRQIKRPGWGAPRSWTIWQQERASADLEYILNPQLGLQLIGLHSRTVKGLVLGNRSLDHELAPELLELVKPK